ncbi:YlbF family regulator [Planctomycetota bacterium]
MSEEISTASKKAEELGEYIENTEIFKQYKRIHEELISDEDAKKLLQEHQGMFMKIYTLEREGKPIEAEDKHALQEIQERLHQNDMLQEYAAVQADFQDMMNKITNGIYTHIKMQPLFEEEEEEKPV